METWDREQLYIEIWETPLVKLAIKYGISAVALGKVCRKLQIPLPGRGYWTKKEFGKSVVRISLPKAKNLPVVHRLKTAPTTTEAVTAKSPEPPVNDPELIRIAEIEAVNFGIDPSAKQHKLISAAARIFRHAPSDARHILYPPYSEACLEIRVSKASLDRALEILNAIILKLESLNFTVSVQKATDRAGVVIDGFRALFAIAEKARVKSRREVQHGSWTATETDYEPTGELEFRVGQHGYGWKKKFADGKARKLDTMLSQCVGALLREGRGLRIAAEAARQREIENQKRREELSKLRTLIDEEEKKISNLDGWVTNWARAQQIRGAKTSTRVHAGLNREDGHGSARSVVSVLRALATSVSRDSRINEASLTPAITQCICIIRCTQILSYLRRDFCVSSTSSYVTIRTSGSRACACSKASTSAVSGILPINTPNRGCFRGCPSTSVTAPELRGSSK
jgi:hypothetical protein